MFTDFDLKVEFKIKSKSVGLYFMNISLKDEAGTRERCGGEPGFHRSERRYNGFGPVLRQKLASLQLVGAGRHHLALGPMRFSPAGASWPFMRQAEVLETVPGVIIIQHSGEARPTSISCAASTWITARFGHRRSTARR